MTQFSRRSMLLASIAAIAGLPAKAKVSRESGAGVSAEIVTRLGKIQILVDTRRAPISAGNFLQFVDKGLFVDTQFYRSVHPENDQNPFKISVLQGGVVDREQFLPPIAHETTRQTGLTHVDGTLSVGRLAPGTGSAGAFFISIGKQPELDFGGRRNPDGQGFAAFGRVTHGMELVRAIWNRPTKGADGSIAAQMMETPVEILSVARRELRVQNRTSSLQQATP
jgi:peptidyl-prolyl cis-trans isomerase A (cyclophilin A)